MSTTVDSKVVEMRFDNKQFESNVQTSLNTLDKLEKSLDLSESAKGLDSISKAADRVSFDGLGSGIESIKMKFSALDVAVATVFQSITQKAISAGSKLVSSITSSMKAGYSEYETQINAVQTILANTQNTTKQVVKQTSQESIATSQATLNKTIANNDAALKSLQKTHKEELKSYQKLADDELDTLDEKHEEALDALESAKKEELKLHEKYAEEELEALEDAQEQELEDLENAYDQEMALMKQVHEQKLELYDQEYMEKLKVVDEERYYKIKAIDDEINAINQLTQQEEEQLEQQKQMAKLDELQNKVNNAETEEDRLEAEQKLNEYIQELSRKQLLKERKSRIEQLKLEKESINEEYDEIEKQLKEEYEAKKKEENENYNLIMDNLKKEKSEKVAALKEFHKEQREMRKEELELEKEEIKERYDAETKALKKSHEEEKRNIKERLELEKEAIQERQDAEIDALKAKHSLAISNLQAQQAAATQIETVAVTPSTIEDVNRALDELNEYADKTIYNFTEMTRNIGTFTAAGIDLDTSVSAIKGIANLAAVSGSTSQQASTAMYQLSQALAAGTVKLMDWNSVVNAGMGGQVFQEALKRTAKVMGTDVDALIAKYGSFRESLTSGWITSDVLTETLRQFTLSAEEGSEQWEEFKNSLKEQGYTEEQAIEILKMGNTATDAATKVKTLTQLFDTLGEAKQSGWTQTWRIIIGDFEEAKEFLTEISDIFGEMINQSAEARNNMLQGWKDLGGRTALLDALRNAFYGIMSMVTPIKEAFTEIFPPTTSKQLYDLTVKIRDLTAKLKLSDEQSINLKTTFKGLFSILSLGKQVVTAVFKAVKSLSTGTGNLGGGILSVTAKIGGWLTKLSEAAKKSDIFTKALNILISPIKLLKDLIAGIIKSDSIQTFFTKAKESLNGFFTTITDNIGPATESFDDFQATVKEKFDTAVESISNFGKTAKEKIDSVIESIKSFMESIKEKIDFKGFESFNGFLAGMSDKMSGVKAATTDMKDTVVSAVDSMDDKASKSPILQFFKNMWDGIKTIASAIGGVIGKIGSKVGAVLTDPALVDLIKGVSVGAIALTLSKFLKSISGFFDKITESVKSFTNITENIKGVLDGVKGCLEAYQNDLNANALMKISKAILIMAAALVVLSFVNAEKLNGAIVAMSSLFAGLIVSMKTFSKSSGSIAKASAACIAMAVAVAILSGALVALSTVSPDSLNSAIISIGVLIAMLTAFSKAMAKANVDIGKGATTLIAFAIAIKIIAGVCKDLSDTNVYSGLLGVAALIAMLTKFSKDLTKKEGDVAKIATELIAFAVAIKILAGACKDLADLSLIELGKGLVGIGALLYGLQQFIDNIDKSDNLKTVGSSLVIIAIAMKIFGSAIKQIGKIEDLDLAKGLGSIIALLTALTIAFKYMPSNENVISTAAAFLILSSSMLILAGALKIMGSMNPEQALIGLAALSGALMVLVVSLNYMKGTTEGSAALLLAVVALSLLVPLLVTLGLIPLQVIGTGLLAIAGAFAVLGLAGALLGPIAPAIMTLAGAFALLGAGIAAIGIGLSLITAGLVALATLGSAGAIVIAGAIGIIVAAVGLALVTIAQKLGEAIVAFANTIRDGSQSICEAVSAVIQAVVQALVESIPPLVEGVLVILEEILDSLDEHLPSILEKVLDLVLDVLDMLIEYTPKIIEKVMEILLTAGEKISEYVPELVCLGVDLVLGLIEGLNSRMEDIIQAAFDLVITFINGVSKGLEDNSEALTEAVVGLFVALIGAAVDFIGGAWELLKKAWDALMESGIFQAIRDKFNSIKETIWEFILKAKEAIEQKFEDFKNAGKDLIGGFIQGIKDKALALYEAAKEVVESAVEGVKSFLGINSPSKLFKQIGIYSDQGLIEGLEAYSGKVDDAAENVGSNMLDAMANSVRNISDILDDEDWQPTIRPVMDLSNVEKGARSIDAMFSKTQAMELGARMSARSSNAAQIQNGVNSKLGNTYTFTQNNYSPKALSRIDIYRQTKNQFSAMERMVTT